ncbi:MAG: shikimate dehydrogenase [Actinomycetaceae bacterium]|nr:shikimate dehydrogenase [Actinomycetaceae bacterium]
MRSFVIGQPIAHSLSPVLHNAAYAELGLDHEFSKLEVAPSDLSDFVKSLDEDVLGLAVTMPHKQQIMGLLDAIEPLAEAVGAVNTVVPSSKVLSGFNTDVYGIVQAIREAGGAPEGGRAVILGARATASSALAALGHLHIRDVDVVARNFAGPGYIALAETRLGVTTNHIPWRDEARAIAAMNSADVIVSTLPSGRADQWAKLYQPKPGAVVLDAAYDPWPSELAKAARAGGARVASGYSMLLHQACQQVELMTGRSAPVDAMRSALLKATGLSSL